MSDDEAYEQLTQDMQAMCRDLSAHAETIPHTQESIDALRELVDRVLEANPDSDLGQYKAYPSWLAIVQAGHGLTREDIAEKARYGGWDPDRDDYMRINRDGDWEGLSQERADNLLWDNRGEIIDAVGRFASRLDPDTINHLTVLTFTPPEHPLTLEDVQHLVQRVDDRLRPRLDPADLEEDEDVYRIGDWGYVRAADYEQAFEGEPEWARDMYMLDGNEPDRDAEWVETYNAGGNAALSLALDRQFNEDRADNVFYTTAPEPYDPVPEHTADGTVSKETTERPETDASGQPPTEDEVRRMAASIDLSDLDVAREQYPLVCEVARHGGGTLDFDIILDLRRVTGIPDLNYEMYAYIDGKFDDDLLQICEDILDGTDTESLSRIQSYIQAAQPSASKELLMGLNLTLNDGQHITAWTNDARIPMERVPDGWHRYGVRLADSPSSYDCPYADVKPGIMVNHAFDFITRTDLTDAINRTDICLQVDACTYDGHYAYLHDNHTLEENVPSPRYTPPDKEQAVSLSGEAKASRDASQALGGTSAPDAPAQETQR